MNRFHLLSLAEDGDAEVKASVPSPVMATSLPTPPEVSPTKQLHAGKAKPKQESRLDRRPRGPRKDESERHQVAAGKGSESRSLDALAAEPEGEPTTVDGEATMTQPRPVYKTVKQFLAEQEEQQRRLHSIKATANPRRPNEGSEGVEDMEVIKKSNDVFTVGATLAKKGTSSSGAQKGSNIIRMTLQDLNKAVPATANRRPAGAGTQRRSSQNERDRRFRPKNGGEASLRHDTRRSLGERRPFQHQARPAEINLKDEAAFPCLV